MAEPTTDTRMQPTFFEEQLLKSVNLALNESNDTSKDMARYMLQIEKSANARGAENVRLLGEIKTAIVDLRASIDGLQAAVGKVDDGLDHVEHAVMHGAEAAAARPGAWQATLAWLDANPTLKGALVNTAVGLLGLVLSGATAYAGFRLAGLSSTPTPVQVAQPITVQASPEPAAAPIGEPWHEGEGPTR